MEIIIVPCTREKVWDDDPKAGAMPARAAYKGRRFPAWLAEAERSGCRWFVLSTKYGLLDPDAEVERYDVSLDAARKDKRYLTLLRQQIVDLGLRPTDTIVVFEWEKFEGLIRAAADPLGIPVQLRRARN